MPTSIPYDPSLTLMGIVNEAALKNVEDISKLQAPVDAAQGALNSLISSKRALTMTKTELADLGVGTDALDAELSTLNRAVEQAAAAYATARRTAEPQVQQLRANMHAMHSSVDSPVDDVRSAIKTVPLAADTMNMDVQYFSFDSNSQSSAAYSAQIASYVSGAVSSVFGASTAMKVGTSASRQVARQVSAHRLEGTLVLSVTCTHKNASVVAPFVLHVDKAIQAWNHLFPHKQLNPADSSSMMKCAMDESPEDKEKFSIVSGTTYGSSFVGMVHVLNTTNNSSSETLEAAAASMQRTMDAGAWFATSGGTVGVDATFARDVKNLLSQQNVQSHVTVLSTGVVPSLVATDVQMAVDTLADFRPEESLAAAAAIQHATDASPSVQSMAESARTAGPSAAMHGEAVQSAISTVIEVEDGTHQTLDVHAMMTALDDHLKKAATGPAGVPINYLLKEIDQKMLAQVWAAKYYPGKFTAVTFDDSEGSGPAAEEAKAKL